MLHLKTLKKIENVKFVEWVINNKILIGYLIFPVNLPFLTKNSNQNS